MRITQKYINELCFKIIGAAIEVHKELGPGLLEQVYEACLVYELRLLDLKVKSQYKIPIIYKGINMNADLRFDLLVEDIVIIELKAVEKMLPVFEAQLLTYMKLLQKPKGLLINFNSSNIFHEGQKTMVNQFFAHLPKE
ncbi:MAG TPA: GxxExxY protein [Saprospiraceae bacterium]|nr:GxxExxY protein [Saprospiraceae bacterium]